MVKAGWWLGAVAGLLVSGATLAEGFRWSGVAEETIGRLETAVAAYRAGKGDDAREAVIAAYFGSFEDRKFEAALRKEIGQQHVTEVEGRFNAVRKGVIGHGAADEIAATVAELAKILREDAKVLEARGVPEAVYVGR